MPPAGGAGGQALRYPSDPVRQCRGQCADPVQRDGRVGQGIPGGDAAQGGTVVEAAYQGVVEQECGGAGTVGGWSPGCMEAS